MKSYDFVRFGRVHPKIVYDIVRFACKSYMIRQGSQASQPGQQGQPASQASKASQPGPSQASQPRPGQAGHQDARTTFAGCAPPQTVVWFRGSGKVVTGTTRNRHEIVMKSNDFDATSSPNHMKSYAFRHEIVMKSDDVDAKSSPNLTKSYDFDTKSS